MTSIKMKAIVCKKSGKPDVLSFMDWPKPKPGKAEILIKVDASSVTRGDVNLRKIPRILLHSLGLFFGFKPMVITGIEFSGVVETIGQNVSRFKPGDQVFGTTTGLKYGGNAEYVCVPEKWKMGVVEHKPVNLTFVESAVLPVGTMTSLDMFRRTNIKQGDKILVYGASGSVGSYAVQIARYFSAEVTAVCGTNNVELVKSLGAVRVIDYTKDDFTKEEMVYDIVFDAVGKLRKYKCKKVLNTKGQFLTVRLPTKERPEHLKMIKDLCESGVIKPLIDKIYALHQVPEAHEYVQSGRKKGNVAIKTDWLINSTKTDQ